MEIGIKGARDILVGEEMTARVMGSGELFVFATPAMVSLVEETAWRSVASYLPSGQGSVGTKLDVTHLAPTPVGMRVHCETELVEIDRRRLVFSFAVSDETGLIGEGKHERFIVDNARFEAKANAKRAV